MSFEIVNLLHTVGAVQPFVRIPQRTYLNFQFHAHHSEKMDFWFGSSIWCALMHSQPCRFHWKKCNLLRKNRTCILLSDISIVEMHWSVTLFISLRSSSTSFDAVWCGIVDLDVTWNELYQFEEIFSRLTHPCQSASMTKRSYTQRSK